MPSPTSAQDTANRLGAALKKLEQMGMDGFDRTDVYWDATEFVICIRYAYGDGHWALSVIEAQYYLQNLECDATVSRWWSHRDDESGNGPKKRKAG